MLVKAPSMLPAFMSIQLFYDAPSTIEVTWHQMETGRKTTNYGVRVI
jgi:hypothetical protein